MSDFSIVTEAEKQQNDICNVLRKIYHLLLSLRCTNFHISATGLQLKVDANSYMDRLAENILLNFKIVDKIVVFLQIKDIR